MIVDRAFSQDFLDGKKHRGEVIQVEKKGRDDQQWYTVLLLDHGINAWCYDEDLEPDVLSEMARA